FPLRTARFGIFSDISQFSSLDYQIPHVYLLPSLFFWILLPLYLAELNLRSHHSESANLLGTSDCPRNRLEED
ncbi:hypothetical protein GIB67_000748, partial [Kingdonia uniflora]